jgi:hypothetical protein
MPYPTMDIGASPTAGKTNAYIPLLIEGVDLYRWLVDTAGTFTGKLKGTLIKPDASTVSKVWAASDSPILLMNTEPKYIKVLLETTDIAAAGTYQFVAEFKQADGWLVAPPVSFTVITATV